MEQTKRKMIAIDLGTTHTRVAVLINGVPVLIPNNENLTAYSSSVSFTDTGDRLMGTDSSFQNVDGTEKIISGVKRLIGRRFEADIVQNQVDRLGYKIGERENGLVNIEVAGKIYSPAEISAFVLQKMKIVAQDSLGEEVTDAVITVPAYFNDAQRQATLHAGKIAGLNIRRIINEPTAAAIAFGQGKKRKKQIAVLHVGGGTADASIIEIGGGVVEIKSTSGDVYLGGEEFDRRIVEYLRAEIKKETGIDIDNDFTAIEQLKKDAEKAKIELSSSMLTDIHLSIPGSDQKNPVTLKLTLTLLEYETMVGDLLDRCLGYLKTALRDAGVLASEINDIILVGGMTRTPKIRMMVTDFFGKEPRKGFNPEVFVAKGAAILTGILTGEIQDMTVLEVNPFSLGVEIQGGKMNRLIDRNSTIPVKKSRIFSTGSDNQTKVSIHVLQGENKLAQENRTLGRFELTDIPPKPRGVPKIEVSLDIDVNGIVQVSAKDQNTGRKQNIHMSSPVTGLSKKEINQMAKVARKFAMVERNKVQGL